MKYSDKKIVEKVSNYYESKIYQIVYYAMSNGGGEKYFADLVNYCRENAVHSHFINMDMHVMYLKHEILLYYNMK